MRGKKTDYISSLKVSNFARLGQLNLRYRYRCYKYLRWIGVSQQLHDEPFDGGGSFYQVLSSEMMVYRYS